MQTPGTENCAARDLQGLISNVFAEKCNGDKNKGNET